jgi:hypothetical protein
MFTASLSSFQSDTSDPILGQWIRDLFPNQDTVDVGIGINAIQTHLEQYLPWAIIATTPIVNGPTVRSIHGDSPSLLSITAAPPSPISFALHVPVVQGTVDGVELSYFLGALLEHSLGSLFGYKRVRNIEPIQQLECEGETFTYDDTPFALFEESSMDGSDPATRTQRASTIFNAVAVTLAVGLDYRLPLLKLALSAQSLSELDSRLLMLASRVALTPGAKYNFSAMDEWINHHYPMVRGNHQLNVLRLGSLAHFFANSCLAAARQAR